MAPEEFVRGSRIDQVTNVFTLARLALVLMGDRSQRYGSVRTFVAAYEQAMRP